MDHLRLLLVPFHPTCLILVAVFALLLTILGAAAGVFALFGLMGQLFLQIWILKYCFVLLEQVADGAPEPPVMSTEMLSPLELRPWVQLGLIVGAVMLCMALGGTAALALGIAFTLLLPATIGVLGIGEPFFQAVNPVALFRMIRGLGPLYPAIIAGLLVYAAIQFVFFRLGAWSIVQHAVAIVCELSFFSLIGGCIFMRRRQLGYEPRHSPERTAAREEAERVKVRARMIDEVFQQVRIGKHIEATRPLGKWLGALDGETAARDSLYIAGQALGWEAPGGLNTLASTLIRHLLRAGRPDAALAVFERLRERSPALTLDSPDDLRTLADYAEGIGRTELAVSMRLETPIYKPQSR
jgi:pentatricopeptide repeat protein